MLKYENDSQTVNGRSAGDTDSSWLSRSAGDGSRSRRDDRRDEYRRQPPDDIPDDRYVSAQTYLRSFDLEDKQAPDRTRRHLADDRTEEERYTRYWELNCGFGAWGTDEGLDEVEKGLRVDPNVRDRYLPIKAAVSQIEPPRSVQKVAVRRATLSQGSSRAWNRWAGGCVGLAIGHTIIQLFDTPEEVRSTPIWFDIKRVCAGIDVDPERVVERAFDELLRFERAGS